MNTVRTYLRFSELDPAHVLTMADLELSVALSSTLVSFNEDRKLVAGIAERWVTLPPNQIRFTLRKDIKWSDGSPVTAAQYKAALDRAKKSHPDDLKALFDSIKSIDAEGDSNLVFTTSDEITKSGILLKLTEPMYGLVFVKNGKLDLSRSAGPFVLKEHSKDHLKLVVNQNWYMHRSDMPQAVEIRRPNDDHDLVESFDKDDWVNLVSGTSLMSGDTAQRFKENHYGMWQRSLDKVFAFFPSKQFLQSGGAQSINLLSQKMDRKELLSGLSGYTLANQFFPRGYDLHSHVEPKIRSATPILARSPVRIIIVGSPFAPQIREQMKKAILSSTGLTATIDVVPVTNVDERMKRGDFDILATVIAVADPNFEGAMSFFIERDPPFIQSVERPNDFAAQMREARSLPSSEQRANQMRDIIVRVQEAGHVLPIFHFSSMAVAKPGVDLSGIPNTDETIPFAKVRIK